MKGRSSASRPRWRALAAAVCWAGLWGGIATADTYPRNPAVDVVHYAFRLELSDASDEIRGRATVTVRFLADGETAMELDLVGRSGPEAITGMTVTSVTEGGARLRYRHAGDRLRIELGRPSVAGEERTFTVAYQGVPADGLIISDNRHGDRTFFGDNWPDRARHWLPTVDHPSDKATCEFTVVAPEAYQVVANGRLVEETNLPGGRRLHRWRTLAPIPTKVMVIGAARFAVEHLEPIHGVPLQSWVYPQDRDAGFRDFAAAGRILELFIEHLGPFPYAKLANVQSTTRYGGMENASNIFYRETAVTGRGENERLLAHELAHQWFGDAVTEGDWHHIWLSEGFATYFAHVYAELAYGSDRLLAGMRRARQRVIAYSREHPGSAVVDPTVEEIDRLLNANTYQKGAWVLHMLRRLVGEEAFWDGIREYYRRFRHGNALTEDFRAVMEEVAGIELGWFFDQWVYRPGHPRLEGSWSYDPASGALSVTLRQVQPGDAVYRMSVELAIVLEGDREPRIEVLELRRRVNRFAWEVEAPPAALILDPYTWVLMEATFVRR